MWGDLHVHVLEGRGRRAGEERGVAVVETVHEDGRGAGWVLERQLQQVLHRRVEAAWSGSGLGLGVGLG